MCSKQLPLSRLYGKYENSTPMAIIKEIETSLSWIRWVEIPPAIR